MSCIGADAEKSEKRLKKFVGSEKVTTFAFPFGSDLYGKLHDGLALRTRREIIDNTERIDNEVKKATEDSLY